MAFFGPIFAISTASVGVRTTFGRFDSTLKPGLNFKIPFIQKVYEVKTNIRQENFRFRVKTKDDAFSTMHISVQYKVQEEDAEKAFFAMSNPIQQIDAYIENVIRSNVPQMTLKELFEDPDSLCKRVKETLGPMMRENGYTIMNTLVTDIEPDKEIQIAMNRVVASERLRQAATNEAEADYIKSVRQAEADRDRKRLQGEGIAEQRKAILDGYRDSLAQMRDVLGISAKEALSLTSKTMYYDTLERIGTNKGTRTLFLTHPFSEDGGNTKSTTSNEVRHGMLEAMESQRDVNIEPVD